jgi:hypothetical protein
MDMLGNRGWGFAGMETAGAHQAAAALLDPTRTLNAGDPGDKTLRNFRYQLLYGVILLAAASAGTWPYVALWCEHYEDFLCERQDGTFDGIQVKTRQPEDGYWKITDEPFVKTIGRFVDLNRGLRSRANRFHFVSNAKCDEVTPTNSDERRRGRCPRHLLEHVRAAGSSQTIVAPFKAVFDQIQAQCGCSADELFDVLKKTDIVHGPSREDIDASVANEHLGGLAGFDRLPPRGLADARDGFVAVIHRASSLQVTDPNRHLRGILDENQRDPTLAAKRLVVLETIIVPATSGPPVFAFQDQPILSLGASAETNTVLEQKLRYGGLADQIDYLRSKERAAEFALMEDIIRRPAAYPALQTQLEQVVLGAVSEAHLRTRMEGVTFGPNMMIEVQNRLRTAAIDHAEQIGHHGYDCLVGVAGLFTSECRVWWSDRFGLVSGVSG